ncbi:MAG: SsrA-binding protein, partial [Terrimicrobiaceae bacterium]
MSPEITTNRKAFRDYHILEKFEAGLELKGTEVKSIRAGLVSLQGAFAKVQNGQ